MNSESEKSLWIELGLLALLVIILVCCAIFTSVGKRYGKSEIMKQAVEAGVGEWTVDKDGSVQFRWKKRIEVTE